MMEGTEGQFAMNNELEMKICQRAYEMRDGRAVPTGPPSGTGSGPSVR